MRIDLLTHIAAGSTALLAGYVALYVTKGARIHRRAGMAFVASMLVMSVMGGWLALVHNAAPRINVPVAILTAYLVVTSLATVRAPEGEWSRRILAGGMIVVLGVGIFEAQLATRMLIEGTSRGRGIAIPFLVFALVAFIGLAGDVRVWRGGELRGVPRLRRHLWRMTFALLVAAASFFLGQAKVFPAPIRKPGLLALPVLLVLATLIYWLWRTRRRSAATPSAALQYVNTRRGWLGTAA